MVDFLKLTLTNLHLDYRKLRENKFYYKSIIMLVEIFSYLDDDYLKAYEILAYLVNRNNDIEVYRSERDIFLTLYFNCDMKFIMTKYWI